MRTVQHQHATTGRGRWSKNKMNRRVRLQSVPERKGRKRLERLERKDWKGWNLARDQRRQSRTRSINQHSLAVDALRLARAEIRRLISLINGLLINMSSSRLMVQMLQKLQMMNMSAKEAHLGVFGFSGPVTCSTLASGPPRPHSSSPPSSFYFWFYRMKMLIVFFHS